MLRIITDRIFRHAVTGAVLILSLQVGNLHAEGYSQEKFSDVKKKISSIEIKVEELRGRYVKPLKQKGSGYFKQRFEKAAFLHRSNDYLYASIVADDLISSHPDAEQREEYYELCWILGDSYSHTKNYIGSRQWLEKVVDTGQLGQHFRPAIIRLIEL